MSQHCWTHTQIQGKGEKHERALQPKCCVNLDKESSHQVLILTPYFTETISNLQCPHKYLQRRFLSQNSLLRLLFQLHTKFDTQ